MIVRALVGLVLGLVSVQWGVALQWSGAEKSRSPYTWKGTQKHSNWTSDLYDRLWRAYSAYSFTSNKPNVYEWGRRQPKVSMWMELVRLARMQEPYRNGRYTFFIPSNQALMHFWPEQLAHLRKKPGLIKILVMYSIVSGVRRSLSHFRRGEELLSSYGEGLRVFTNDLYGEPGRGPSVTINDARIVDEHRPSNGHVFILDRLLLPRRVLQAYFSDT